MKLTSNTFADGKTIPEHCAFGVPDPQTRMQLGPNKNPHLQWSKPPAGTESLVLICMDPDAPASAEGVNQAGEVIAMDRPRGDFAHWVMVDIPAGLNTIDEGAVSSGVVSGGKQSPDGPAGARQGLNDYTGFLAGDADMKGQYFGYDGPCPPWNDERVHRYCFRLYAIDLARCPVDGAFTAPDVLAAIEDHVLAEAQLTGTYTLNPDLS